MVCAEFKLGQCKGRNAAVEKKPPVLAVRSLAKAEAVKEGIPQVLAWSAARTDDSTPPRKQQAVLLFQNPEAFVL